MNESTAPWRALEDDAPAAGPDGAGPGAIARDAGGSATRTTWVALALVAAAVIAGAAIWLVASSGHGTLVVEGGGPGPDRSAGAGATLTGSAAPGGDGGLVVDVQGAVARPGIVHLPRGSRVADAIAAAGGYGPRVAADRVGQVLNLAAVVKDGDQVIVPSRDGSASTPVSSPGAGGSATGGGGGSASGGGPGPVDLNHATVAELDALPGIGPVTAAKIVAAREEQAFTSVDELRTRKVLGSATFDKVKDLVVVR